MWSRKSDILTFIDIYNVNIWYRSAQSSCFGVPSTTACNYLKNDFSHRFVFKNTKFLAAAQHCFIYFYLFFLNKLGHLKGPWAVVHKTLIPSRILINLSGYEWMNSPFVATLPTETTTTTRQNLVPVLKRPNQNVSQGGFPGGCIQKGHSCTDVA